MHLARRTRSDPRIMIVLAVTLAVTARLGVPAAPEVTVRSIDPPGMDTRSEFAPALPIIIGADIGALPFGLDLTE